MRPRSPGESRWRRAIVRSRWCLRGRTLPTLDRSRYASADGLRRGAYVLADAPNGEPELILIASGSEVALIVAAAERLQAQGIAVRCVSMPSWELFDASIAGRSRRGAAAVSDGAPGGRSGRGAGLASLCRRLRRRAERGSLRRVRARQRDAARNTASRSTTSARAHGRYWASSGRRLHEQIQRRQPVRWKPEDGYATGRIIKVHPRTTGYKATCVTPCADDRETHASDRRRLKGAVEWPTLRNGSLS